MIGFFRRIRRKMANENKFVQYSRYAIGEIVLVVIGILIAISINNWNENRKQANSEIEFVAGIKNDLKQDQEYIDLIVKIGEAKIEAFNLLNREFTELFANDKSKLDSLLLKFFVDNRTFFPMSGSYQSGISGNELNKFKNKKEISEIIGLYDTKYIRLIENGQTLDKRFEFITKKYTRERRIGHFNNMTLAEVTEVLDDIFYYSKQLIYYISNLKGVEIEINKILNEHS